MKYLFGPSLHYSVSGATPTPVVVPGYVGTEFDPTNAIVHDDTAQLRLLTPVLPTDVVPTEVHVYYIPSGQSVPATPEECVALTGLSSAVVTVPVPPPAPGVTFQVTVAPKPGIGTYVVQVVNGYGP